MNTRSNRYFRPIITACAVASGLGVVTVPGMVQAQGYPNKPIRAIVGFPAGGGADIIARMIASGNYRAPLPYATVWRLLYYRDQPKSQYATVW